jgi:hypothetical protein
VNLVEAITIFVPGVLAYRVVDGPVGITPLGQTGIDVVLIGVDETAGLDGLLDQGLDGHLLNIFEHLNDNLTATLEYTQNRWFFLSQGATPPFAFQSSSTPFTTLIGNGFWIPFVTGNDIDLITFNISGKDYRLFFSSTP